MKSNISFVNAYMAFFLSYTLRKLVWAYLESRKLFILNLRKMLGSQFYYPVYSLVLSLGLLLAYLKTWKL